MPRGSTTTAVIPARAAYAAALAAVLPVDAHSTVVRPSSSAFATATTIPRSLNEPVGFTPSNLRNSSLTPTHSASRGAASSGVDPSPSVSAGVAGVTGSSDA